MLKQNIDILYLEIEANNKHKFEYLVKKKKRNKIETNKIIFLKNKMRLRTLLIGTCISEQCFWSVFEVNIFDNKKFKILMS